MGSDLEDIVFGSVRLEAAGTAVDIFAIHPEDVAGIGKNRKRSVCWHLVEGESFAERDRHAFAERVGSSPDHRGLKLLAHGVRLNAGELV